MPSIGVLEHYQKPTEKPTRRIKKSGGQSLVRSGLAEWIIENVLVIMLPQSERMLLKTHAHDPVIKRYIPKSMPHAELPGIRFQDPNPSDTIKRRFFVMAANRIATQ